ncbi:MAG: glycosyltransferase family 2 protein [Candidatus Woykebacteria bacterium]
MQKPYFSVVIPVHNKAPHVARSIQSVLDQTYSDFDLILINDASTDNSLEEIEKFDDPRITIFHRDQPGPGGYAARNLGTEKAKSEWVAFLDADDEWMDNHLERVSKLISKYPKARFFSSGWENFKKLESGEQIYEDPYFRKYGNKGDRNLNFNDYLHEQVQGRSPVCTIVACIFRETLLQAGGFPAGKARRGGDVDTWLRCIELSNGLVWSDHIGAIYHRDSVNMVTKTNKFEAECERLTVQNLVHKYSGKSKKLLKQFSNRRTISAWRQNTFLPDVKNIVLLNKLYYSVNPIKNICIGIISLFPDSYFQTVRKVVKSLK